MSSRWRIALGVTAAALVALAVLWGRLPAPQSSAADAPRKPATAAGAEPEWEPPRFAEHRRERHAMVRRHIQGHGIGSQAVIDALRHVPRHEFVPREHRSRAYRNRPLPIGHGQTISQPYIVAYMTEQLELQPGDKVLEVGTGSGYQAAVLSELTAHVYTIEIIRDLAEEAQARFERLGYDTIKAKTGDGYYGWAKHAPFDAIIVTCAAGTIPPPLIRQLKPGGRMCIPVGPTGATQRLILVTKDADGKVKSRSLIPVVFVPLTRKVR
ncbi:MAG: protein-L-isoaspartate(D-aspartate) O-methyltransferase [Planctomycetota bacterium]